MIHFISPSTWRQGMGFSCLASLFALLFMTHVIISPAQAAIGDGAANSIYEDALKRYHNGDVDDAIIFLKNALKENSQHLPSRILMAEILIAKGDGAAAEIELNFVQKRGADLDRLVVLFGHSYLLQQKYDELLEKVRPGTRSRSVEAEIALLRGQSYLAKKSMANADSSFRDALLQQPGMEKALLGRAQVAAARKEFTQAMAHVDEALQSFSPSPSAWIMKAKLLKIQGYSQEAIASINEALRLNDRHVLALLTRAGLYIDEKRLDEAEADLDGILAQIPNEPQAKYLKAIIHAARGDAGQSAEKINEIIATLRSIPPQVMKTTPTYFYLAGLVNYQFGHLDEARGYLNNYLRIQKNDLTAMRLLGALELQAGDPVTANLILTNAHRLQPDNPTIMTLLGFTYLDIGSIHKANRYFERVVNLLPDNSQGLANLARGKMAAGSIEDAIANLIRAEKHDFDDLDIKVLLSQAYQRAGAPDKAVAILQKLIRDVPGDARLHQLLATAHGLNGQHGLARTHYQKSLDYDKDNLEAITHLSRMDVIEEKWGTALDRLQKALTEHPNQPRLMLEIGDIYLLQQDRINARFWYQKAYSLDSNSFDALTKQIDLYVQEGVLDKAIHLASEFSTRAPEDDSVHTLIGQLYLQDNNPSKAIEAFKLAAKYAVNRGQALLTLADARLLINDRAGAAADLRKAIAWDNSLTDAYVMLIKMAIAGREEREGLQLLKELRSLLPDNPASDLLAGELYMAVQNYPKAEVAYHQARQIQDHPLAALGLYQVYRQTNRSDMARQLLENWHHKHPNDLLVALTLGHDYKITGEITKAAQFHNRLETLFSDHPLVLNNAANIYFENGQQDHAVKIAEKALSLSPDNVEIMDTLGWILSRTGKPEAALPYFRKALVRDFQKPAIHYHLALTLYALDRKREAIASLRQALGMPEAFVEKETAGELLRKWQEE